MIAFRRGTPVDAGLLTDAFGFILLTPWGRQHETGVFAAT